MAPLPIFSEGQDPVVVAAGTGPFFPPTPGMPVPRAHPVPVGAPDVDDVFVVVVSLAVVASLTIFVLLQAISALKEVLDTRSTPFCAIPSIATFRKHGLLSLNSSESEHQQLLESSMVDSEGYPSYSRWIGPTHRCQFTLSPERYDSDTSSTLTRSSSSSDSTVVGGRICVVYDDTVESRSNNNSDEEDDDDEDEDDEEEEDGGDNKCVPLRTVYEPRTRVRREAIFIQ